MTYSNKIIVLSHCILNQNAVLTDWERATGAFPLVKFLLERQISFLQLPCPEFLTFGKNRSPMTVEEYDRVPNFRSNCREWLRPIIKQIMSYQSVGYHYMGVIGIMESPNCSITGHRGVLMEEFFMLLKEKELSTNFFEIPIWYSENNQGRLEEDLAKYFELEGKNNEK